MTEQEVLGLANRLSAALTSCDLAEMRALLGPDFHMWHNFSGKTYDRGETLDYLGAAFAGPMQGIRYDNIRRMVAADGFVQQHIASAQTPSGGRTNGIDACLVVRVANGHIVRIDEYLDSAKLPQS